MFIYGHDFKRVFIYIFYLNLCVYCRGAQKEGDECFGKTGKRGYCIAQTNCEHALNLIDNGISPVFCTTSFQENFNSLVCCQDPGLQQLGSLRERVSVAKCKEYYPELLKTGVVHSNAVGGRKTRAKKFKHMALVGYGEKDDIKWLCGGSLISDKFVLTAAHCIYNRIGDPEWVRLGELDTANDTDDADPHDFAVIRAIAHPDYQIPVVYNDIGLLELERPATFSNYIRPACLYQTSDTSIGYAIATGWGHTSFGGQPSSHLIEVNLIMVNNSRCQKFFQGPARTQLPRGILTNIHICAGGNDGRDTCQGDSGGPLQVHKKDATPVRSIYEIIGITSFGAACGIAATPGVYTRVSAYIDWIESIVWP